ncbi:MAG: hypothetical protein AD073_000238 [Mycoplasmataceae bacterium]|nr:MAG: hypothetical protein AD073_000238 [Mycoplasmataceae bacterium]
MENINNEKFKIKNDDQVVNSERKRINPKYLSYIFLDLKVDNCLTKESLYLYSCASVSSYWINQDVYDFYSNKFGSDSVELFIRGNPELKEDYYIKDYIKENIRLRGLENEDFYERLFRNLSYMHSNRYRYFESEEETQWLELKTNNLFFYIVLFFFLLSSTFFVIKRKKKCFFCKWNN